MQNFLSGATLMAGATIAVIFLRSWRRTSDFLFLGFSIAFFCFSIERLAPFSNVTPEQLPFVYLIRLVGFCAILCAIWRKNKKRSLQ
jgi:hypothetical protein